MKVNEQGYLLLGHEEPHVFTFLMDEGIPILPGKIRMTVFPDKITITVHRKLEDESEEVRTYQMQPSDFLQYFILTGKRVTIQNIRKALIHFGVQHL